MRRNLYISVICLILYVFTFPVLSSNGQIQLNRFNLRFPVPTAEDLNKGYIDAHYSASDLAVQINTTSSSVWNFYIMSEQPFFSPENFNKPCYHLLWKLSSEPESKYRPVSLQKCQVATGRSLTNINLDFRLKLSWSDPPAEYGLEILFVLESST